MNPKALSPRFGHSRRMVGFTLIELLVTFAVVAVMLTLAAPSFITFQRNAELTSTANSFVAAMSAARAEAMKRQLNTMIRPASGDDWMQGWTVYVDTNWDFAYTAGTDIEVSQQGPLSPSIAVLTNDTSSDATSHYLMFSGSGFLRNGDGTFASRMLEIGNGSGVRRIIANPAGRLRVCNPATETGCNTTDSF